MASVPWGWLSPQNSSVGGGLSAPWPSWTGARMHLSTQIHVPTNEVRGSAFHWPTFPDCPGAEARGERWRYSCDFYLLKGDSIGIGKQDNRIAGLTYGEGKSVYRCTCPSHKETANCGPMGQTWSSTCFYKVF